MARIKCVMRRSINPKKEQIHQLIKQISDSDHDQIKLLLSIVLHVSRGGYATIIEPGGENKDNTFHNINNLPINGLAAACLQLKETPDSKETLANCEVIDLSNNDDNNYLDVYQSQNISEARRPPNSPSSDTFSDTNQNDKDTPFVSEHARSQNIIDLTTTTDDDDNDDVDDDVEDLHIYKRAVKRSFDEFERPAEHCAGFRLAKMQHTGTLRGRFSRDSMV